MSTASTLLIGGHWKPGRGGQFDSINPTDGSVSAHLSIADDVAEAVAPARRAFEQSEWRRMRPHLRARQLHPMAYFVDGSGDELVQSSDNGKSVAECRSHVGGAASAFRYYAALCETAEDLTQTSSSKRHDARTRSFAGVRHRCYRADRRLMEQAGRTSCRLICTTAWCEDAPGNCPGRLSTRERRCSRRCLARLHEGRAPRKAASATNRR